MLDENQYIELGGYNGEILLPICEACWATRQNALRDKQLVEYRKIVSRTLRDITDSEVEQLGEHKSGERRAVVLHIDSRQPSVI